MSLPRSRWGLLQKFLLPNLALLLLASIALIVFVGATRREQQVIREAVARVSRLNELTYLLGEATERKQRDVLAYRFTRERILPGRIRETRRGIHELLAELRAWVSSPRSDRYVEHLRTERRGLDLIEEELLGAIAEHKPPAEIARIFSAWSLKTKKAAAVLADLNIYNVRRVTGVLQDAERAFGRERMLLIALILTNALVVALLGYYVARNLVRPLLDLTEASRRIAKGESRIEVRHVQRRDEIGELSRAFTIMLADLSRATAGLKEAIAVRDEFLSIASHELKTPMTALRMRLELAQRAKGESEVRERALEGSVAQVDRMARLVSDLLDVSTMRSGRMRYEFQKTDLSKLAADVMHRYVDQLRAAGCSIALSIAPGVEGFWDPHRLEQVLTNLLSNAMKYAPGSEVSVEVSQHGDRAVVVVRDSGPGIPKEKQAAVFERFERAGAGQAVEGLGLGLYLVKQIVLAHGGEIRLESEPGQGTRFTIELPIRATSR